MRSRLSVVMITKNAGVTIQKSLSSIKDIADEILIVDDYSTDKTKDVVQKYKTTFIQHTQHNLGSQKSFAVSQARNSWVLLLDSDEVVTPELSQEILSVLKLDKNNMNGYMIPFQTHLFGKPIYYGGENYSKLILFQKQFSSIDPRPVHEFVQVKGKVETLKNKMLHYSYRSIGQMFTKFHSYAVLDGTYRYENGEKSSFKKIIFYPIHMFWSRFVKDKGYKDGVTRILLDLGFAYMEYVAYMTLFIKQLTTKQK